MIPFVHVINFPLGEVAMGKKVMALSKSFAIIKHFLLDCGGSQDLNVGSVEPSAVEVPDFVPDLLLRWFSEIPIASYRNCSDIRGSSIDQVVAVCVVVPTYLLKNDTTNLTIHKLIKYFIWYLQQILHIHQLKGRHHYQILVAYLRGKSRLCHS